MLFLKIPLVIGLVFLYLRTRNPILSAAIWGVITLIFGFLLAETFSLNVLVIGAVRLLLAFGYFVLLDITEKTPWWWIILILGGALLIYV